MCLFFLFFISLPAEKNSNFKKRTKVMFFCALALVFAQLFSQTSISCPGTMLCDARVPEHK